jgi:DNA-binding transcriptional ArsR family regulator
MTSTQLKSDLKTSLTDRPLVSRKQATELMGLFKILSNDTRLCLLHAIVQAGEITVMDLANVIGMKPQAVSNQLQRLADRGIIRSRRNGNNVYYTIKDPCVVNLFEYGLCLMEDARRRRKA